MGNPLFYALRFLPILLLSILFTANAQTQTVHDDFEGSGTIDTWAGDDCDINTNYQNPFPQGINTSATVLRYADTGGQYANIRFEVPNNFDLSVHHTFSLKIYIASNGLTGNQANRISLKLQDGTLGEPWTTQCEIIKPVVLNQWQVVTFNFNTDPYFNFDPNSGDPILRSDFNRVLLQVNGENNNDQVVALVDDILYDGTITGEPVYDQLAWSDEFDVAGSVNSTKWFHQTQLPAGGSWFNGEQQHYTNRSINSYVSDNTLKIVAKKETYTAQGQTKNYTSARLNSKFAFKYGKVEFRAKFLSGAGTWPALWTLAKNVDENGGYWDTQGFGTVGWPACGEMDIMEHWGNNQNFVQSATHTTSSSGATVNKGGRVISTASTAFHIYTLEWYPKRLVFSVDGIVHYIYNPTIKNAETWPFTTEQYLLMNVAIEQNIYPSFTQGALEVDYVRVYKQNTTTALAPKISSAAFNSYPNPVTEALTIELNGEVHQPVRLKIFSVEGKLMKTYEQTINGHSVTLKDLGELPAGLYMMMFEVNQQNHHLKFAKQ